MAGMLRLPVRLAYQKTRGRHDLCRRDRRRCRRPGSGRRSDQHPGKRERSPATEERTPSACNSSVARWKPCATAARRIAEPCQHDRSQLQRTYPASDGERLWGGGTVEGSRSDQGNRCGRRRVRRHPRNRQDPNRLRRSGRGRRWDRANLSGRRCGGNYCSTPDIVRQKYCGPAHWEWIKRIKDQVDIPVVGNGAVHTPRDAKAMLEQTGCDFVMIGTAAFINPLIFHQTNELLETGSISQRRQHCGSAGILPALLRVCQESSNPGVCPPVPSTFVPGLPASAGLSAENTNRADHPGIKRSMTQSETNPTNGRLPGRSRH